jgi:hypothetical protein
MVLRKKAQDGTKAATLVAIIGGLIILYILFVPASQRQQLLNISNATNETTAVTNVSNQTLLLEHPGLLEYSAATEYEKSIPPLTLLVSTQATTLKTADSIIVRNNWFSGQAYNMTFSLGDVKNTQNVVFSFNVDEKEGDLILILNGQVIYQDTPKTQNVAVTIPKDLLKGENSLLIKADSVGFAFWKTNKYKLSTLNLIADVTDISGRKSQSIFVISSTENNNLDSATLRFYVDCANKVDLGKLDVEINSHQIYSQVPICGDIVSIPLSTNILVSGENTITFSTEFEKQTSAYYQVDNILIKLSLKPILPLTYYFDLNSTQLNAVKNGTNNLVMEMLFTDSVTSKKADMYVNGLKTGLETRNYNYSKNINSFAKEGNNAIKLVPLSTFEIVDLIVKIV